MLSVVVLVGTPLWDWDKRSNRVLDKSFGIHSTPSVGVPVVEALLEAPEVAAVVVVVAVVV